MTVLDDSERPVQLVPPQRTTRPGDFDLWLEPDFSIIVVVRRAFAHMDTGSIFMPGIVAMKLENETSLFKNLRTHFMPLLDNSMSDAIVHESR